MPQSKGSLARGRSTAETLHVVSQLITCLVSTVDLDSSLWFALCVFLVPWGGGR